MHGKQNTQQGIQTHVCRDMSVCMCMCRPMCAHIVLRMTEAPTSVGPTFSASLTIHCFIKFCSYNAGGCHIGAREAQADRACQRFGLRKLPAKKTVIEISRNYKTTTRNSTAVKTKNTSRPFHLATYKQKCHRGNMTTVLCDVTPCRLLQIRCRLHGVTFHPAINSTVTVVRT